MNPLILLGFALYLGLEWLVARLLASYIGWGGVGLVMMVLFIIGTAVCRRAGFSRLRAPIVVDGVTIAPSTGAAVGDSGLRFLAGLMIALPGLITSTAGFLLLIPGIRRAAGDFGASRIRRKAAAMGVVLDQDFRPSRFSDGAVPGEVYRPESPRSRDRHVIEGSVVDDG